MSSISESELCFYDLILAWSRIIKSKHFLSKGVLLGCGLNELAKATEFDFSAAALGDRADLLIDYNNLPFPDEGIDFIVSTQLLEHDVGLSSISELSRVLAEGGYVLMFNFCSFSLLSLQRLLAKDPNTLPRLLATYKIRQVLRLHGLHIVVESPVSFRPLVAPETFSELLFLEFLGATMMPQISSCNMILAKKDLECTVSNFEGMVGDVG